MHILARFSLACKHKKEDNHYGKEKYYQRPDGLYECSRIINGKRVMFRGKTCREVDQKLLTYQERKETGRTFPEVADEWERDHEKRVRDETRRVYGYAVKRLKESFPGSIADIRPIDVMRHIRRVEAMGYAVGYGFVKG